MSADPEVIRNAAEIVKTGGLCKEQYFTAEGKHCTVGALRAVAALDTWGEPVLLTGLSWADREKQVVLAQDQVADVVREQFSDRAILLFSDGTLPHPFVVVTSFNDHPDTTADDVVMVLEKAAVKASEWVG